MRLHAEREVNIVHVGCLQCFDRYIGHLFAHSLTSGVVGEMQSGCLKFRGLLRAGRMWYIRCYAALHLGLQAGAKTPYHRAIFAVNRFVPVTAARAPRPIDTVTATHSIDQDLATGSLMAASAT